MTSTIEGQYTDRSVFLVGHDPRLQESNVEAEYVFFMDYLKRGPPVEAPELKKYGLAKAVVDYVGYLTSGLYGAKTLDLLYVTNLCNKFLPHPRAKGQTVLISDSHADRGIRKIDESLGTGAFKLMLPMSLQVAYHLVRRGFLRESKGLNEFLPKARPRDSWAALDAYVAPERRRLWMYAGTSTGMVRSRLCLSCT